MAVEVIMPKAGSEMEEGEIVQWFKQEGDEVKEGEVLLEIVTDKVNMEVEAEASGTLLKILHPAGSTVPVVQTIAWIGQPGEAVPGADGATAAAQEVVKEVAADVKVPETKAEEVLPKRERRGEYDVAVIGGGPAGYVAAIRAAQLGAKVVTISGPDGYIYDKDGISGEKIDYLLELRASGNNRAEDYVKKFPSAEFHPGKRPWEVKCDIAFPCATQNELHLEDAKKLVENGVICVTEAANMPSTLDAINYFLDNKILFSPGKASNAGGVATSGLEMTQNSIRLGWSEEEVDAKLKNIMVGIHNACVEYGKEEGGFVNYVKGANIAGFVKVADAMLAQGVV